MKALLLSLVLLLAAAAPVMSQGKNNNVTYDGRSLIINGERKMLFSGSIHYPRSTPAMWPSLLDKAKEGGIDVIDTYVFWNGGLPFWLHDVPGITFRSDNEPFKRYMQRWVTHVVNMMKYHKLFASQGGPIILSQIENEYQRIENVFHDGSGSRYVQWAANMAVGLNTGVPWVMCSQQDAPDPVINACNGFECGRTFRGPNSLNKPALWTENWTGFLGCQRRLSRFNSSTLWHTSSFESDSDTQATLSVRSNTHIVQAFVNGVHVGNAHGGGGRHFFTLDTTANLTRGTNDISLLSVMVGYQPSGAYLERLTAGIRGVRIQDKDFTQHSWRYQVGLWGERLQIFKKPGLNRVHWKSIQGSCQPRLTWYKALFDAPPGDSPLALNLGSMGKGQVWVNGQSIGRYWVSMKTAEQKPSQTWYNVPRSFLTPAIM